MKHYTIIFLLLHAVGWSLTIGGFTGAHTSGMGLPFFIVALIIWNIERKSNRKEYSVSKMLTLENKGYWIKKDTSVLMEKTLSNLLSGEDVKQ